MHRRLNDLLTICVVLLALYIVLAPLMPAIQQSLRQHRGFATPSYIPPTPSEAPPQSPPVDTNRLVIPSIGLNDEILQGSSVATVDRGLWLRPRSEQPGSGGNSVIVGHRYSYNASVAHPFYSLDDVSVGEPMYVVWSGTLHTFVVREKKVVPPNDLTVEAPSQEARLTLYTCTPLWTSKNRLVIVASPVQRGEL